jgi:phospholipid-binding lipoprotein MlaA
MSIKKTYPLLISLALVGCASTGGPANPKDPWEPYNRSMYKFNDAVDKAVLKPVAQGYGTAMPEFGKTMVTNFFSNLDDILVTINDVLQFKFSQAASDGTRVLFNSTFGLLGFFNVASGLEKHNEDFGQTLGYWGIGPGPYVVLPFFGPRTVRDSFGLAVDSFASPVRLISSVPIRNELYVTRTVDTRTGLLDHEKVLDEAAMDRYSFIRDGYLQQRRSLIYDGNPPREKFNDEEDSDILNKSPSGENQGGAQPIVTSTPASSLVTTEAIGQSVPQGLDVSTPTTTQTPSASDAQPAEAQLSSEPAQ